MNAADPVHRLEEALRAAGSLPMRFGPSSAAEIAAERLDENLRAVHAELDAPRPRLLERLLRRARVPDLTVPLIAATPALRRSWFAAIGFAVLFALSASSNAATDGAETIVAFLTVAPLIPVLGVALAFGRGVDPTHDLVVAAPRDTFQVFLIRALTVLVASAATLLGASALLPAGGWYRVAWLLPALALTSVTLAGAPRRDPRQVAFAAATTWVVVVFVVTRTQPASAMFGAVTQVVCAGLAVIGAYATWRSRRLLEVPR